LIIFSPEPDARSAFAAQHDIQAALPGIKVITARPIIRDISSLAKKISEILKTTMIGPNEEEKLFQLMSNKKSALYDVNQGAGPEVSEVLNKTSDYGKLVNAHVIRALRLIFTELSVRPKPPRLPGAKLPPAHVKKPPPFDLYFDL